MSRLNLEWLIEREEDIVCTAVMMRDIPCDPKEYNTRRFTEMKRHVGWDGKRATRPRDYGGVGPGAQARWEYNNAPAHGHTLSYSDDAPWKAYSDHDSKVIEAAYQASNQAPYPVSRLMSRSYDCDVNCAGPRLMLQGYQRFAFIGKPEGAPGPYFVDFGNECDPDIEYGPQQRRADSDQVRILDKVFLLSIVPENMQGLYGVFCQPDSTKSNWKCD